MAVTEPTDNAVEPPSCGFFSRRMTSAPALRAALAAAKAAPPPPTTMTSVSTRLSGGICRQLVLHREQEKLKPVIPVKAGIHAVTAGLRCYGFPPAWERQCLDVDVRCKAHQERSRMMWPIAPHPSRLIGILIKPFFPVTHIVLGVIQRVPAREAMQRLPAVDHDAFTVDV